MNLILLLLTLLLNLSNNSLTQECPEVKPTIWGVIQNDITNHDKLPEQWNIVYNTLGISNITADDFNVIQDTEICFYFIETYSEVMEETVLLTDFDDKTYDVGFFEISIGENFVYISIITPASIEGIINYGYTTVGFYDHNLEFKFAYSY